RGYMIAVDAYTARPNMAPLMAMADIVKVDFRSTDDGEQASCAQRYAKPAVKLLADRVDSHAELDRARRMGYSLYQGPFFDKPQELIVTSLVRARFCEQIGQAAGMETAEFDLFMVGLLSAVDAILDRPMLEVLADLPLSADVKGALMGKKEGYGRVLGMALA